MAFPLRIVPKCSFRAIRRIVRPQEQKQPPRMTTSSKQVRTYAGETTPATRKRVAQYEYEEEDEEERPWAFDDISSIAHGELEQHREARQYARITAYEMPKLAQLAKRFELPAKAQCLQFRYTSYMGEKHPAEAKVVLEFAPDDLDLTDVQRNKLIKLVGSRYNPDTQIVRMSCEMFELQEQNKLHLSDLLDRLLETARDPKDNFEDIPFDFRHRKAKPKPPKFPKEWTEIARAKEQERILRTNPHSPSPHPPS